MPEKSGNSTRFIHVHEQTQPQTKHKTKKELNSSLKPSLYRYLARQVVNIKYFYT